MEAFEPAFYRNRLSRDPAARIRPAFFEGNRHEQFEKIPQRIREQGPPSVPRPCRAGSLDPAALTAARR